MSCVSWGVSFLTFLAGTCDTTIVAGRREYVSPLLPLVTVVDSKPSAIVDMV